MIKCAQFRIDFAFGLTPLQLVAGSQVDEAGVASQARMDLGDPAEHLLRHPPVVGVSLRRRPELAKVIDLPQVRPKVPANAERERDYVLGQRQAGLPLQSRVNRRRSFDGRGELPVQAELTETGGVS